VDSRLPVWEVLIERKKILSKVENRCDAKKTFKADVTSGKNTRTYRPLSPKPQKNMGGGGFEAMPFLRGTFEFGTRRSRWPARQFHGSGKKPFPRCQAITDILTCGTQ